MGPSVLLVVPGLGREKGVKPKALKVPFYGKNELHRCSNNFPIFV